MPTLKELMTPEGMKASQERVVALTDELFKRREERRKEHEAEVAKHPENFIMSDEDFVKRLKNAPPLTTEEVEALWKAAEGCE